MYRKPYSFEQTVFPAIHFPLNKHVLSWKDPESFFPKLCPYIIHLFFCLTKSSCSCFTVNLTVLFLTINSSLEQFWFILKNAFLFQQTFFPIKTQSIYNSPFLFNSDWHSSCLTKSLILRNKHFLQQDADSISFKISFFEDSFSLPNKGLS